MSSVAIRYQLGLRFHAGSLTAPLKEAGSLVKLGVICEILDIEGVPAGALLAATSLVRPFSIVMLFVRTDYLTGLA